MTGERSSPIQPSSHDAVALVTGGRGFIGSHLCRQLTSAGMRVHVTSRSAGEPSDIWQAVHAVDLADHAAVGQLIDAVRPDYVFHLASHVSGARDLSAVHPTFVGNLVTTVNLLDHVTRVGCRRFVLAGSLEQPTNGEAPSSPYAASKLAAAQYALMCWQLYKTPATVARIFMVYGPGQHDHKKLVPYVTRGLLNGETPRLTSGVRPVDWVYVQDVAETLLKCAITPGFEGQTIDVGTGKLTTVRGVVERISKLVQANEPVFGGVEDRPLEQVRAADPSAAASLLGRSLTDLDQGLAETVAWFRDHK